MPTHRELAKTYQDAVNALLAVKTNFRSTPEDRVAATAAIDELNKAWINDVQERFEARTASLNLLVERLNRVSATISTDPLEPLKSKLNDAAARTRALLHKTAREALQNLTDEEVPTDPDSVAAVAAPPGDARISPAAAESDASDSGDTAVPQRPSLPDLMPSAAEHRARSKVPTDLYDDYMRLFSSCLTRPEFIATVNGHLEKLQQLRVRYEKVGDLLGVPWWFVGAIHGLESGYRFDRHLHNGDPLDAPTVHVPAARPPGWAGTADKSWEASARDALGLKKLDQWDDWCVAGALYQWERYNGFGYRKYHSAVLSPYLWSFTNHYRKGKYVADGRFDAQAVSAQCGAAAILRALVNKGVVVP